MVAHRSGSQHQGGVTDSLPSRTPVCELLGRELCGRPGCRFLQALHCGDGPPDPHGDTGRIRKIKNQVQSRTYEFNMTSVNSMQGLRASREGLAEPIDWTIVKKDDRRPLHRAAAGTGWSSALKETPTAWESFRLVVG